MTEDLFRYIILSFTISVVLVAWFSNVTNNAYKRGYRDGYTRGKAVAREGLFE